MHLKRWITSIILLPLLIWLIYKGGLPFTVFIALVAVICLWEYFSIVLDSFKAFCVSQGIICAMAAVSAFLLMWAAHMGAVETMAGILAFNFIIAAFVGVGSFKTHGRIAETVFRQVLGVVYIPLALAHVVLIRNSADGALWIFLALCVIFAGDTAAYYVGSYAGKRPLCPAVSPNKTIEGALGGLGANTLVGAIFKIFFIPMLSWPAMVVLVVCAGAAGQLGDLFESQLKRSAGIKDSGAILPGHGGMLDRIDAVLFAVPLVYYFKEYLL